MASLTLPNYESLKKSDLKGWSSRHQYRSTYTQMSKGVPPKRKKYVIPGYQGYIPGVTADNNYGKSATVISKEELNRAVYLPLPKTEVFPGRHGDSAAILRKTLGVFGGGLDDEYHTVSRHHGQSTLPREHPNYANNSWATTYSSCFGLRTGRGPGLTREKVRSCRQLRTLASGFAANSTEGDGARWVPLQNLSGGMGLTEYRAGFNPNVPFHSKELKPNLRGLKKNNGHL